MGAGTSPADAGSQKPAFRTFHIRDAADLTESTMTLSKLAPEDMAALARAQQAGATDGAVAKILFEDAAAGISLSYAWFKAHYIVPRHSHDADCLYYVISGELRLGTETLKTGDGFFVPSDGLYTFAAGAEGAEILEFRTAVQFDFKLKTSAPFWARMIDVFGANRETWDRQTPPLAVRRLTEAE